jgi:hypothetical protein
LKYFIRKTTDKKITPKREATTISTTTEDPAGKKNRTVYKSISFSEKLERKLSKRI